MDLNSIFQNIDFSKLLEKWNQKDSNVAPVPAPALNPDTTAAAAPVTQPKSNQELLDQINSMREQRAQLDKIDAARPQPTEFKKKWNDYVGMGLAGLGQAVALRGGGKVMGPSAMDILKNAKEDNAAQNAKLLADWQAKRQAVVDKMSNIKTTAEMVGKGLTDQSRIAKDTAAANLATAQAGQIGQLTPYQKQQLALQQDRLNEANRHNTTMEGIGRDKVTNANGGTVSPEPGQNTNPAYVKTSQQEAAKQDVKLLADEPNIVKRQQMVDEVLGTKDKAGLLNAMIKNDEIGTKWQTAGKLVENLPSVAGKMATTVRESSLSTNQQRYKAIMESMAQDIINDAKGVATDSDREAARKIMSGTLEMDPEAAKTALLQVQDYNNRVVQRIHEAKTRMGRQEIPLTAPKATSANLDKYGF